jgi:hypothetical protein
MAPFQQSEYTVKFRLYAAETLAVLVGHLAANKGRAAYQALFLRRSCLHHASVLLYERQPAIDHV